MNSAPITSDCPKCQRAFAAKVPVCPFCGARRDGSSAAKALMQAGASSAPEQPSAMKATTAQKASIPSETHSKSIELPKVEMGCPACGGTLGSEILHIRTIEYQGRRFNYKKYLYRSWRLPCLCSACAMLIERRRYIADVLTLAPLVVFFFSMIILESKLFMAFFLLYLIYLFKALSFNWADGFLYGNSDLYQRVSRLNLEGDPGSIEFPVSAKHCAVRVLLIPVFFALLLGFVKTFAG